MTFYQMDQDADGAHSGQAHLATALVSHLMLCISQGDRHRKTWQRNLKLRLTLCDGKVWFHALELCPFVVQLLGMTITRTSTKPWEGLDLCKPELEGWEWPWESLEVVCDQCVQVCSLEGSRKHPWLALRNNCALSEAARALGTMWLSERERSCGMSF